MLVLQLLSVTALCSLILIQQVTKRELKKGEQPSFVGLIFLGGGGVQPFIIFNIVLFFCV